MKQFIIVVSWSLLQACSTAEPKNESSSPEGESTIVELTESQLRLAGIDTGRAISETINSTLTVNGVVEAPPQNIVSVSFPLGGYLKSTRLLPGMKLRKGDVMGMVEDQALIQLQQDYLVTKAKLQYLRQDLDRQQLLNENKVNADKTLQLAKAEYLSQQVLLKGYSEKLQLVGLNPELLSETNLSRSVALRSPINGYVSKVNVNIGKYVNPTDVLFELINPTDLHGALTVFEKDMGKLRLDQKVSMQLVDQPDQTYRGKIILFTRNIDDNRSGTVHCHFDQLPGHLLPGMFLNATVYLDERKAATVPEQAVVRYGGKQHVFRQTGNRQFEITEVQTEPAGKGKLAIYSDHADLTSQPLVLKNAYAILGKMKNSMADD